MDLQTYFRMLAFGRPKGSRADIAFRERFLLTLPNAWIDIYENIHVCTDKSSRVLWTAHTDTVHATESMRQTVSIDWKAETVGLSKRSRQRGASCLGADDTTGCFLLREMILANVPGYYIFHFGEERGGIGARRMANNHAEWLSASFDYAIALDRRGDEDIITHQSGGRTASDAFAWSMSKALGMLHSPCDFGVYTDTAEYSDLIPECTNISVGYRREHSANEWQDLRYLRRLHSVLTSFDASHLVCARDPRYVEPTPLRAIGSRYDLHGLNDDIYLDKTYAEVQAALRDSNVLSWEQDLRCPVCGHALCERSLFDECCYLCGEVLHDKR